MSSLRAIYFSVQDVGKHVKKSKRRFIWKFITKGQEHVVELYVSYLSGKKDILLDSRSIYQAQKVTSSFQFPFQVEGNQCMLVQHGDQYELRINNQVFSHLYNQERMKREFEYVEEGNVKNKGFDDDYGSKNKGFGGGGSGGKNAGFGARSDSDEEVPKQSYKPRAQTYEPQEVRSKPKPTNEDDGFGFAEAFNKFDFKSESAPRSQSDAFNTYNNKYSESNKASKPVQKSGFDSFEAKKPQPSGFEQFETKTQSPNQQFGAFEFGSFDKPAQTGSGSKPKPQPSTNPADLLGLDFGGGSTQTQPSNPPPQNGGGFDDFFGQPSQQTNPQFGDFGTQAPVSKPQGSNQNNLNDLMGLDLGGSNTTSTTANTNAGFNQPSMNQSGGLANFLDDQPQAAPQQTQSQPQAQPQQKKDLWSSELVNLDPTEVPANKNNQNYDYGGYGNSGYGNQNNYGNYNTNAGYGGGMNTNTGMGGYNTAQQGYGGNQSYGTNQGGYGGNQGGYGGNQGGYGGNQGLSGQSYGGFESNANSNQGYNAGGYGASNQQYGGSNAANDVKTPFDF